MRSAVGTATRAIALAVSFGSFGFLAGCAGTGSGPDPMATHDAAFEAIEQQFHSGALTLREIEAYIEANPDSPNRAQAHLLAGLVADKESPAWAFRHYEEARDRGSAAIRARACAQLGYRFASSRHWRESQESFEAALESAEDPDTAAEAHIGIAKAMIQRGRENDAQPHLEAAAASTTYPLFSEVVRDLRGDPEPLAPFLLQIAAFRDRARAEPLARRLEELGYRAEITTGSDGLHRLRCGPFSSLDTAKRTAVQLEREFGSAIMIVAQ